MTLLLYGVPVQSTLPWVNSAESMTSLAAADSSAGVVSIDIPAKPSYGTHSTSKPTSGHTVSFMSTAAAPIPNDDSSSRNGEWNHHHSEATSMAPNGTDRIHSQGGDDTNAATLMVPNAQQRLRAHTEDLHRDLGGGVTWADQNPALTANSRTLPAPFSAPASAAVDHVPRSVTPSHSVQSSQSQASNGYHPGAYDPPAAGMTGAKLLEQQHSLLYEDDDLQEDGFVELMHVATGEIRTLGSLASSGSIASFRQVRGL